VQAIKLRAKVGPDHRIELELPAEIPEGEVEIIVIAEETSSLSETRSLREFFEEVDQLPRRRRTKEEIDRYIAEERASWD
jgi:hypothetical protein